MRKKHLLSILLCCTSLAACGGGGNISENLATTSPDPVVPSPDDPPVEAVPFLTGEYLANWGLDYVNPIPAWSKGYTGKTSSEIGPDQPVTVAVLGSGVDGNHADLNGQIHASSDTTDGEGTGTLVAGLIAAKRNGVGMHGVAYDAQVLALNAGATDVSYAAAIDKAIAENARVITIYSDRDAPTPALEDALERAATSGAVVILSAGDSPTSDPVAEISGLSEFALDSRANGQFVVVGAADKSGNILGTDTSTHHEVNSHVPGGLPARYFMLAPGLEVYSTFIGPSNGENYYGQGTGSAVSTSFVSAAAALLLGAFPTLTADEVVNILLTTATDYVLPNTHPGVDEVNGWGLLNIGAALAPIGTNSVTIKTSNGWITSDLDDAGLVSGGMFGDGIGVGFGQGAIFLDDYDRAYTTNFGNNIIEANPTIDFGTRFNTARDYRHANLALSPDFYLSVAADYGVAPDPYLEDILGLREDESVLADNVNFRLTKGIGKQSAVAMSVGGSLSSVLSFGAQDTGFGNSTHLSSGMNDPWTSVNRSSNYGDGQRVGFIHNLRDDLSLSVGISSDVVAAPNYAGLAEFGSDATRKVIVTQLKGSKGRLGWKTTAGLVSEEGMVLDSHSTGVLGLGSGADTTFFALGTEYALTDRIRAFGRVGQSSTRIDESDLSAFSQFGTLQASHFAAGVSLARAFSPMGSLSLSVSQPLRLERGVASMNIASSYDYTTETPNFTNQVNGLTPTGRELDLEAAYRYGLGNNASLTANILYQSNPGHVADRDSVISFMLAAKSSF